MESVSLIVGIVSIVLAAQAMLLTFLAYRGTQGALSEIRKKAALIDRAVSGTQAKLVDTVTEIANPRKESQEEKVANAILLLSNATQDPQLLERLTKRVQGQVDD